MWKSLSITKKIWLSLSILVLGYLGSMVFGFYLGRQTESRLHIIAENFFPATKQGQFALTCFKEQVKGYYDAVMVGDESYLELAHEKHEEVHTAIKSIIRLKSRDFEKTRKLKEIKKRLDDYTALSTQTYRMMVNKDSYVELTDSLNTDNQKILKKTRYLANEEKSLKTELTALAGILSGDLRMELASIGNITKKQRYLNMIVFFVVVISALSLISLIVHRSISRPLKKTYMLENAVEQSIDGIAVSDLDGKLQFVNHSWAKMHGFEIEELMGKHLSCLHTEEQLKNEVEVFIKKAVENGSNTGEVGHKRKDGTVFPALMSVNILTDHQGKPISMVGISKDITEQKKNEKALEDTRQELIEKAHQAGMADIATGTLHNVGNILNSVKTSAQMINDISVGSHMAGFLKANNLLEEHIDSLEEFICNNPKGKKLMQYYLKLEDGFVKEQDEIQSHIDRLNDKVNAIVEVISAQQSYAGTAALAEKLSLSEIVEDALTMQAGSTERYNIRIIKDFQDIPKVDVQKVKLVHILINLIQNAKDALLETDPHNRRIELTIYQDKEAAFIKIYDTGNGILPENLEIIFSHGFTTKKTGHGFGLHSCANYMTEMGGRMWAESKGTGKGSTFILRFLL